MDGFPESVDRRLDAAPVEFARSARQLLPKCGELPLTPPYERVLHAILDLAEGDWRRVRTLGQAAREDWRDVLWWASGGAGGRSDEA
ncbi:hypothetical protein [Plantactinospora sp. GCM10030261]|uniref:hypothetical protein n=1 Tax=Plantactinospora sp. GCM10030261 TaxID=3273420 RepID=UPI0036105F5A